MKVALFVHCFFPEHFYGTETYTLEVARNLRMLGHSPVVVCAAFQGEARRDGPITQYEYAQLPVYCIDKNWLPHKNIRETYHQPEMRQYLMSVLRDIQPDLVHVTHLGNHTAMLLDVLQEVRIPAVATLTDFFGFCFTSRLEDVNGSLCSGPNISRSNCIACTLKEIGRNHSDKLRYRLLGYPIIASLAANVLRYFHPGKLASIVADLQERPGILQQRYAHYRAVIAPTRFLAAAYLANGLRVPLHHMHFGVDMPAKKKVPVAPGTPLRFGFIGQLAPHKGPDILIEAFRRLPAGGATLDIYGSGSEGDEYSATLLEQAHGCAIAFRGTFPNERIAEVLASLDFLVIPSRWYENSPLVLLAALASQTPAVVSDVEGMAEFIDDGINGILFQRGSIDALTNALLELIQDPVRARAMSANTNYQRSTKDMTNELVGLYSTILRTT